MFRKLPISFQFSVLLLVLFCAGLLTTLQLMRELGVAEARNQARTVADMVDNVGAWASQYKGVWVKGDVGQSPGSFLDREPAMPREAFAKVLTQASRHGGVTEEDVKLLEELGAAFHRKNPALVQRELADVTQASAAKAKFRMTSDKFMNPKNAPNGFESMAIEKLRQSGDTEFSVIENGSLLFARRLVATQGCISCHGNPVDAPEAVRTRYGSTNGYGYKIGDVAGVISVSVPLGEIGVPRVVRDIQPMTWGALAGLALVMLLAAGYLHTAVIRPTRMLEQFASEVANGPLDRRVHAPDLVDDEYGSRNEIHRLSHALKAMYQSMRILHVEGYPDSRQGDGSR